MIRQGDDDHGDRATKRPPGEPLPIDRERVARLRREIAAGTYAVDPDRIAAAMVATDLPPPRRTR